MGVDVKVKMEIAGSGRKLPDILWGFVCSREIFREHRAVFFINTAHKKFYARIFYT